MKPDAGRHMLLWGASSGFILGGAFIIFLFSFANIITVAVSAYVGAIFGVILGGISGFVIEQMLPLPLFPFTKMHQKQYSRRISIVLFVVNMLVSFVLLNGVLSLFSDFVMLGIEVPSMLDNWAWLLPPLIAALAAVYATHRYLFRLRLYSETTHATQKSIEKRKHQDTQELVSLQDYMASEVSSQQEKRS
jgi:hypothetical protein